MKLGYSNRDGKSKAEIKQIRRNGDIVAVLYSKGNESKKITVCGQDYAKMLRSLKKGSLPTTIFTLTKENDEQTRAVIKDIQYHPTTYQILHLDFVELIDNTNINIKVPIYLKGDAECEGVKLGGFLRQIIRHLQVRCLPKDIPAEFSIDVTALGIKQSKRLSDVKIPDAVRPLAALNSVLVTVAKR